MDITSYILGKKAGGGSGDLDWESIGYSGTPQTIVDGYNYAKYIQNNWDSANSKLSDFNDVFICPMVDLGTRTNMYDFARDCKKLIEVPLLDTSNITYTANMFKGCSALTKVPLLDISKVIGTQNMFDGCNSLTTVPLLDISSVGSAQSMFNGCSKLTNESLNNILAMCIGASSFTGTKTLAHLGIKSLYYPASQIQALSNYQDFIDAGWTIGY